MQCGSDSRILLRLPSSIFSFISVQCNVMHDAVSAFHSERPLSKTSAHPLLSATSVRFPFLFAFSFASLLTPHP
jgi:hypothetical protein